MENYKDDKVLSAMSGCLNDQLSNINLMCDEYENRAFRNRKKPLIKRQKTNFDSECLNVANAFMNMESNAQFGSGMYQTDLQKN